MITFWVFSAMITLIVLLMLVIPIFRAAKSSNTLQDRTALNVQLIQDRLHELERDYTEQRLVLSQYQAMKQELQLALARDLEAVPDHQPDQPASNQGQWAAWAILLFVPLLAVSLYMTYGDSRGFDLPAIAKTSTSQPGASAQQPTAASIEKMVEGLANRLKQNPDDPQGWFMLGRSYIVMERYADASNAYEQLHKLVGDDINVLLQYAQAKAMSDGGQWNTASIAILDKAIKLEPENPVVLSVSGVVAAQQGKADRAIDLWHKAQKAMQPDSQEYKDLDRMIASTQLKGQTSSQPTDNNKAIITAENTPTVQTTPSANSNQQTSTAGLANGIEVKVSISPALKAKADPGQTIFIYAQALSGPPMPIAVARKKVSELPVVVTLDDSMAMMPTRKLSSFEQVRIAARISKSGSAMPGAGDLQGKIEPVETATTQSVSVVIDHVL